MIPPLVTQFANAACDLKSGAGFFFGFPHWYDYLDGIKDANGKCIPSIQGLSDVWLIVAAIIEILLRVAALLAVAMVIYGGVSYMTSQGEPDKTSSAKSTVVNALIGLGIAVMAAFIVTFIAGSID